MIVPGMPLLLGYREILHQFHNFLYYSITAAFALLAMKILYGPNKLFELGESRKYVIGVIACKHKKRKQGEESHLFAGKARLSPAGD